MSNPKVHDCPDCRCRSVCEEGHCIHDAGYYDWCCRCTYRKTRDYSMENATTIDRPGCKFQQTRLMAKFCLRGAI